MTKFKIEIQITLLALIIGAAVLTTGYFAYKSLSNIVHSIHRETLPDNKLFLIKDIAIELTTVEHTLRLYILTNNEVDLLQYHSRQRHIVLNLKKLKVYRGKYNPEAALIDSIGKLAMEKLELWQEVLNMHFADQKSMPSYSKIYSTPDNEKVYTIPTENERIGLLHEIFYPKGFIADAAQLKPAPDKDEIKKKLRKLELEMTKKGKQKNIIESQLIEKNIIIGNKINQLIAEAEAKETTNLMIKTNEANRLAAITYKWLALFTFTAISLLFVALFVFFDYLKKTRTYQSALNEARNKAEILAMAKEQFAANVSHELRTPVNAIYGLTEQVLQKPLEPETSEMVSVIFKSASHLRNIINDTLDFSKIQANKITLEAVHFSPVVLFEEIISLQKYEASQKGISLRFNWYGKKTGALVGDPLRLKQILINLISNAIKFTELGEVAVIVKGSVTSVQFFELEVQVSDTGIGISEKDLSVIFDEFVQINNKSGKKYSGTGLGLSIVKKMVELQDGKISVESKVGKGTKFTVNIPYEIGATVLIKKTEDEILLIPENLKQLHVLIADDEEYNRFLIRSILSKWGVKFKEAKNGNEVIDITKKEKFDVILMDINMPEMNGIDASKAIAKFNSGETIVATTAAKDLINQQACINAGMKHFLLKPYSEKDLFDTLITILQTENKLISANKSNQINMAELMRIANGDMKFLNEMILLFIKSSEEGIANIEEGIRIENWKNVYESAHKMAAPSNHIGAGFLYKDIKKLEKMAHQTEPMESIIPLFQKLKNDLTELNAFLKSHLNEIETYSA